MAGDIMFIPSGNPERDRENARRYELHTLRMALNVCPNGCAQMVWDDPHNRHCPTCNFTGFSTKPYDMITEQA